jgi:hypothetical protein
VADAVLDALDGRLPVSEHPPPATAVDPTAGAAEHVQLG